MIASLAAYVEMVWPVGPGWIALRGFSEKGSRQQRSHLRWLQVGDPRRLDKIAAFIREGDRRGLACYCVPGIIREDGKASAADVVSMSTLCLDIDNGDIESVARAACDAIGSPTMTILSGGITCEGVAKRYLFWRLSRETTVEKVCLLRQRIAAAFGGDQSFGRAHQPIRLPGSLHKKASPRLVEIIQYDPQASVDPWQAELKLPRLGAASRRGVSSALGLQKRVSLDDLITRDVGHGDAEVTRFEAITRMAGMMIANIHDVNDSVECEQEYQFYAAWCRRRVVNVERDYRLRVHWNRLLAREQAKRQAALPISLRNISSDTSRPRGQ